MHSITPLNFCSVPLKAIFACLVPLLLGKLYSFEHFETVQSISIKLSQILTLNVHSIESEHWNKNNPHHQQVPAPSIVKPTNPLQIYNKAVQKVKLSQQEARLNLTNAITLEQDAMNIFCSLLKDPQSNPLLKIVAGRECVKLSKNYQQKDSLIEALGLLRYELPDHPNIWLHHATLLFISEQFDDAMDSLIEFKLKWPKDRRGDCLQTLGSRLQVYSSLKSVAFFKNLILKDLPKQSDACKDGALGIFGFMANSFKRNGSLAFAEVVYDQGYRLGFYPTKWQRSSVLGQQCLNLKSQPLWKVEEVSASIGLKEIRNHWKIIRSEAELAFSMGVFDDEKENLVQEGLWQQLVLFENGQKVKGGCLKAPRTCQIVESFPEALSIQRGQVKFSLLQPGTWIHPHTGPTNCRLRAHLGLIVPSTTNGETVLRIGENRANWEEGEFLIIDDSFEHEVWNNNSEARLILLIDFWHPGLSEEDKLSLKSEQIDGDRESNDPDDSLISITGLSSRIKTTLS